MKKCLNLLNIGDEFINKVVDSGYVKDVVDFYKLDSYTILKILRPQLGKLEDKDFIKEIGNNKYSKDVLKQMLFIILFYLFIKNHLVLF